MSLDLTALQKGCFSLEEAVANAFDKDFINGLSHSQHKLILATRLLKTLKMKND